MKSLWLLIVLFSLGAHSAFAQEASNEALKAEASAHFRQGGELFREGAYRAALVELQRAHELLPDYRVLFNIGQTQLQLGEYVEAIKAFEAYLVQGGSAVDAQRRQETEKDLAMLRKRVATLAISVNVDGADVFVDSASVGKSPLNKTIPVSVGRHRVLAQSKDGATNSVVIDVAGGDLKEIALEIVQKPVPVAQAQTAPQNADSKPARSMTKRKKWAIGLLASSGATLGATAVMAFLTKGSHDDYKELLDEPLVGNKKIDDARSETKLNGYITDGLGILTVALATTGVVLLTVGDKGSETESPSANVSISLAPNGFFAHGDF